MLIDTQRSLTDRITNGAASAKSRATPCLKLGTKELFFRRRLRCRVEALNHFGRKIESGIGGNDAPIADAEDHQQALVEAKLLDDGIQLLLKVTLELVGEILNLLLCILLGELHVAVRLVDVFF